MNGEYFGVPTESQRSAATVRAVDEQISLQWGESFRRYGRIGLILILVGNLGYGLANFTAAKPGFERLLFLQALHMVVLLGGIAYLRAPRTWSRLQAVGLSEAAFACFSTALVGGLGGRTISTLLSVVSIAFISPAILPWGFGVQLGLAVAGIGSVLLNSWLVSGSVFGATSPHALVGIGMALAGSVYMARVFERTRRALAAQELLRSRAELDLQRLNADLEHRIEERTAELEAALGELQSFTYTASHDLRSPLRGINGLARLLLEDTDEALAPNNRALLDRICHATTRMDAMIDALLTLGRVAQTTLRRDRLDLSVMARSIADDFVAAEPARDVEWSIAEGVGAHGDRALVDVVLMNLLQNAWKFTCDREAARIEVGTENVDGERAYFVRDNGRGFEMDYVDRIFEPFLRLDGEEEGKTPVAGTGIGLTTVQRIVKRHGGRIWVESAPGNGSTFRFTLGNGDASPAAINSR